MFLRMTKRLFLVMLSWWYLTLALLPRRGYVETSRFFLFSTYEWSYKIISAIYD